MVVLFARITVIFGLLFAVSTGAFASDIPNWLKKHVGLKNGQIAPVVLDRARAHYLEKRAKRQVSTKCYFAVDATRPSTLSDGTATKRFYTICEDRRFFSATSSGYGNGRKIPGADFANGRQCARHFSNAEGSNLTAGGGYITAETRTSFKGYIGINRPFQRSFLVFDGEGETSNARDRAIGGHQAAFVRVKCRLKKPDSPHANSKGFVPYGTLVDYTSGRSNGCTTWSESASKDILAIAKDRPTALYIYPNSKDINAVAKAVARGQSVAGKGIYWNQACLNAIGSPKFWPKQKLQPLINEWRANRPKRDWEPLPICK